MGKVYRLHNKVEPFAALLWALGIVLYLPKLDLARRHFTAVHKAYPKILIWSDCLHGGGELVQFSQKTC